MVDRDEYTGVVDNKNLFIVLTMRCETVRMISVRSATKREKERYYDARWTTRSATLISRGD